MRPSGATVIDNIPSPIERVFALLTDPVRIAEWLPGCSGVETTGPLRKGSRLKARFGVRSTEFEVVDFSPPTTFGWSERGQRQGWKTFFRLDAVAGSTAVTVRDVWAPRTLVAWLRGRLFDRRRVDSQLEGILSNVRRLLAS
jgi:uncharacterized protein YndB with AHSA1/START domain